MVVNITLVYDVFNNHFLKINDSLLIPLKNEDSEKIEYFLKRKKAAEDIQDRYGIK